MAMTENAANIALCNLSLGLLGATSITLNGSSTNHTYCTAFFDACRDEILAMHRWNFAKKRAYAVQTTDPLWGLPNATYAYQYTVPTDAIRIWMVDNDKDAKWEREGDYIITDRGSLPDDYSDDSVEYLAGEYITSDFTDTDLTYSVDTAFTSSDEETDLDTYCTALADNYRVLKVGYVYQFTTMSSWPIYAYWCAALNLAMKLSSPILQSESASITLALHQQLHGSKTTRGLLDLARGQDAQEEGVKTISTTTLTGSRQGALRWGMSVGQLGSG